MPWRPRVCEKLSQRTGRLLDDILTGRRCSLNDLRLAAQCWAARRVLSASRPPAVREPIHIGGARAVGRRPPRGHAPQCRREQRRASTPSTGLGRGRTVATERVSIRADGRGIERGRRRQRPPRQTSAWRPAARLRSAAVPARRVQPGSATDADPTSRPPAATPSTTARRTSTTGARSRGAMRAAATSR